MTRALVLGGGGVAGIAWETGVIAGLAWAQVNLLKADTLIGTSAGAVVAMQLGTGRTPDELYQRQLEARSNEQPAKFGWLLMLRYWLCTLGARRIEQFGARVGALALRAKTEPEEVRRSVIDSRLRMHTWPERKVQVTMVNARTGEFRVVDRHSGVPVVDAVAASCAVPGVWPAVTIDGEKWIDGGMRSPVNADLAMGHQKVVIIAPIERGFGVMASLDEQVRQLSAQGAEVEVIVPDAASKKAMGSNLLDPSVRADAAHAGFAQAANVAGRLSLVWGASSTGPFKVSSAPAAEPLPALR